MKDILADAPVNTDLKPFVFSLFLKQWLERFRVDDRIIPVALLALILAGFIALGPLNLGLFVGGFTASSLEFLLILWFQVIFGFVYQMTGVIFAVFMAGLVTGSLFRSKTFKHSSIKSFMGIQAIFAIFSALVVAIILLFSSSSLLPFSSTSLPPAFLIAIILILVFISGHLMGMQFALSAHLRSTGILRSAGESFSADLVGSAIGVLLVSIFLVPQLGIPLTGFTLAGLNAVALGVIYLKK
jgi:spermidine synthase